MTNPRPDTDTLTDAARANEFKSRLGNDYDLAFELADWEAEQEAEDKAEREGRREMYDTLFGEWNRWEN